MQRPDHQPEEIAIRDAITAAQPGAAEAFCRRHLEGLYEFIYYRVGRRQEQAEDLVQDTFLLAIERMDSFDGRSSLHTWLCGIAKNLLRSERRKRRPMAMADLLDQAEPEIDRILAEIESEPLPEALVEAEETRVLVGAALSSLPPDYRDALIARYVNGQSVPEFARASGRHIKAAESTLHRAKRSFGKVFSMLADRRGEGA
ncbi:MAG: RNA polymerase sigma-70 factor (ECF subfamily) [Planctomycetota bacterium]|jgi:RNA polymerase sigma-70 factor (ECF subfamily)